MLFEILLSILILFFITILYAWYLGFFAKIVISEEELGPLRIIYSEVKGSYSKLNPHFQQLINIMKLNNLNDQTPLGIFFDNPDEIVDKSQCRTAIGFIISDSNQDRQIQKFLEQYKLYKMIEFPKTLTLAANEFPYRNWISKLLYIFLVYPKFDEAYNQEKYKKELENCYGSIEIYNTSNNNLDNLKSIKIHIPITQKAKVYNFSSYPCPQLKNKFKID